MFTSATYVAVLIFVNQGFGFSPPIALRFFRGVEAGAVRTAELNHIALLSGGNFGDEDVGGDFPVALYPHCGGTPPRTRSFMPLFEMSLWSSAVRTPLKVSGGFHRHKETGEVEHYHLKLELRDLGLGEDCPPRIAHPKPRRAANSDSSFGRLLR